MRQAVGIRPDRAFDVGDACLQHDAPKLAMEMYEAMPLDPPRVTQGRKLEKNADAMSAMAIDDDGMNLSMVLFAAKTYEAALLDAPNSYTPHLKRLDLLCESFSAVAFGASWFGLRRLRDKDENATPPRDPAAPAEQRPVFPLDIFADLMAEIAQTTRLLPIPQQLQDASFLWKWLPTQAPAGQQALRAHIQPLLQDLLLHRLPDAARHTPALDRAALVGVRNLSLCEGFARECVELLAQFQASGVVIDERTLDGLVDAYRHASNDPSVRDRVNVLLGELAKGLEPELVPRLAALARGDITLHHRFARISNQGGAIALQDPERWRRASPAVHNAISADGILNIDACTPDLISSLSDADLADFMRELDAAPKTRVQYDFEGLGEDDEADEEGDDAA
jgi:hypothetical protein